MPEQVHTQSDVLPSELADVEGIIFGKTEEQEVAEDLAEGAEQMLSSDTSRFIDEEPTDE